MRNASRTAALAIVVLACNLPAAGPVHAFSDSKSYSPAACLPRGPGTTASELSFGASGITNTGSTDESVLCALIVDGESYWVEGTYAIVGVAYRAGAVPGRITCTAFVASSTTGVIGSSSAVADIEPAYTKGYYGWSAYAPASGTNGSAVVTLACVLNPKVTLQRITLSESQATSG